MNCRNMIWILPFALLSSTYAAGIEIALPSGGVTLETETRITVTKDGTPLAGANVKAIYNPKSEMAGEPHELGATDAQGQVAWHPRQTGIAEISVNDGEATKNTVVLFKGLPIDGLIIFLFAGAVLYGGIILAVLRMRKEWDVIGHVDEDVASPSQKPTED